MGRPTKMGELKRAARQLGVTSTTLREQGWKTASPARIQAVMGNLPDWLAVAQERRQAQIEQEARDKLCRDLVGALVDSVHDAWFQELKCATSYAEIDAIDARWSPEASRAKREARRLAGELFPWAGAGRIEREQEAARTAGVYRAGQLARRASGAGGG